MIPTSYLAKWADKQAGYMAQLRLEAWMRGNMPELMEGKDNDDIEF